jgi:hypothetical protein
MMGEFCQNMYSELKILWNRFKHTVVLMVLLCWLIHASPIQLTAEHHFRHEDICSLMEHCYAHPFLHSPGYTSCNTVLTHSLMEPSPSWEAANCAATRELPSILWNPEIHHRIHISPPSVPILSQIDPIHTIPSYLSKIHFNIVHPSTTIRCRE